MKLSPVLRQQHIGRYFREHWRVQGKKVVRETGAHDVLKTRNIPIYQPEDILATPLKPRVNVVGIKPKPVAFDNTHPNWHDRPCLMHKDCNVLLEGLNQAKVLVKTVEIQEGLPDRLVPKATTKEIDNKVRDIILYSHLFDAEQKKLPKLKDPLRPAWNFPRVYGITDRRVNQLIVSKLLYLIENIADRETVKERGIYNDLFFSYPFERNDNLIQFELRGDTMVMSSKALTPITSSKAEDVDLPDIFPITETNTLEPSNIYETQNIYPLKLTARKNCPHTLFIHYNATEVKNIFEEEVTEPQVVGRSLIKTFTAAASYARKKYGENTTDLPEPVTLQCVQTDGRLFHFGVLQLNTLNLEGKDGVKNIWYQTSRLPLFESCSYNLGKPTLVGYNSDVIKHLIAFYENV